MKSIKYTVPTLLLVGASLVQGQAPLDGMFSWSAEQWKEMSPLEQFVGCLVRDKLLPVVRERVTREVVTTSGEVVVEQRLVDDILAWELFTCVLEFAENPSESRIGGMIGWGANQVLARPELTHVFSDHLVVNAVADELFAGAGEGAGGGKRCEFRAPTVSQRTMEVPVLGPRTIWPESDADYRWRLERTGEGGGDRIIWTMVTGYRAAAGSSIERICAENDPFVNVWYESPQSDVGLNFCLSSGSIDVRVRSESAGRCSVWGVIRSWVESTDSSAVERISNRSRKNRLHFGEINHLATVVDLPRPFSACPTARDARGGQYSYVFLSPRLLSNPGEGVSTGFFSAEPELLPASANLALNGGDIVQVGFLWRTAIEYYTGRSHCLLTGIPSQDDPESRDRARASVRFIPHWFRNETIDCPAIGDDQ